MTGPQFKFEGGPNDTWRLEAACRDNDPNLFFPVGTTGPALEQIKQAKAICATCVVRVPCLEYALTIKQEDGIWGGMSEDERRKIYSRRIARQRGAI